MFDLSCVMYHVEKEKAKRVIDNICNLDYFQKAYVKIIFTIKIIIITLIYIIFNIIIKIRNKKVNKWRYCFIIIKG